MFQKILIALDDSAQRKQILDKALSLASRMQSEVLLLHVLSAYGEGSPGIPLRSYHAYYPILDESTWSNYQHQWEEFEQEGIDQLRQEVEEAERLGVRAEFTQTTGEPPRIICQLAKTWQADLIILGSHGRSGISELLLGSVSNAVMHRAPCSVLVIRSPQAEETSEGMSEAVSANTGSA